MAAATPGPDAARVHTVADLVTELDLLRVRAARGTRTTRVSLTELAGRVGEPRSTVHTYVTGKHLPPADVLDRIVIALGATPAEQPDWGEAWFRCYAEAANHGTGHRAAGDDWVRPVPRQLPRDTPGFRGRRDELDRLEDRKSVV